MLKASVDETRLPFLDRDPWGYGLFSWMNHTGRKSGHRVDEASLPLHTNAFLFINPQFFPCLASIPGLVISRHFHKNFIVQLSYLLRATGQSLSGSSANLPMIQQATKMKSAFNRRVPPGGWKWFSADRESPHVQMYSHNR